MISAEQKEKQLEQMKGYYKEWLVASRDEEHDYKQMNDPSTIQSLDTIEMAYDTNEMVLLQMGVITDEDIKKLRMDVEKELESVAEIEKNMEHKLVSRDEIIQVIDTGSPFGKFYGLDEDGVWIGVDNENGEAYIGEFVSQEACQLWLDHREVGFPPTRAYYDKMALAQIQEELTVIQEEVKVIQENSGLTSNTVEWDNELFMENMSIYNEDDYEKIIQYKMRYLEMAAIEKELRRVDEPEKSQVSKDGLYWYEMTARPISLGAQPKGWVDYDHGKGRRHGVIAYEQPLTEKELSVYELSIWQDEKEVVHETVYEQALTIQEKLGNTSGLVQWDNKGLMNHLKRSDPETYETFTALKKEYEKEQGIVKKKSRGGEMER